MSTDQQALLIVAAWFTVALVNGVRDYRKDDCYWHRSKDGRLPFWVRPGLLLFMWLLSAIIGAIIFGANWFMQSPYVKGWELIAMIPVIAIFVFGALGIIGTIGCSFFIPWVRSDEITDLAG